MYDDHSYSEPVELIDRGDVLRILGGSKPLHVSTLYRGISEGYYPRPINVAGNRVRWIKREIVAVQQRQISERDKPRPGGRRRRIPDD